MSHTVRIARAGLFAATCVLLAALGHVMMSGMMLPWWAIPMTLGWIGLTAWIVADRERGVPFVVVSTLVAQAGLHLVFTLAQSMTPHEHSMAGMSSGGMVVAHVVAAALSGLWLAYGERAVFAVLRSVALRILVTLRLLWHPPATPHAPRVRPADSPAPLRELALVHAITSRGPPRGL